jgi:hypothetical protein
MKAQSGTGPAIRPGGQEDSTPAIVQHRVIPEAIRAHGAMADPDYTDFTAMACGAGDRSPEQWARAMFQDAISSRTGRLILRGLLRLRLEAPRGLDLRAVTGRTEMDGPPVFSSVYQTQDEWVAEFCNKTVHSLMHIGWVADDSGGGYHAQMAVLTKPNGWFGKAYMAAIKPFRYALIYPMLLRSIGRRWQKEAAVARRGLQSRDAR